LRLRADRVHEIIILDLANILPALNRRYVWHGWQEVSKACWELDRIAQDTRLGT
jgi:hypothetical protein